MICSLQLLDHAGSEAIGKDAGAFLGKETGVLISDDLSQLQQADCLIDFTRPEGTMNHVAACLSHNCQLIIGTTGFSEEQKARIQVYKKNHLENPKNGCNILIFP